MPEASGSWLHTEDGIAVGDTVAELRSSVTATVFMALNDSTFFPEGFYLPTGEYGALNWDWISNLQRALNENGAQLVVDGTVGPNTRSAVEDYRISHGLDSVVAVLQALIEPPDGATIASISSRGWFWEFECGTLEQWGWGGC
jgi:peptidoglycan hydrolase-like protein with peptidoglycan-binding domain